MSTLQIEPTGDNVALEFLGDDAAEETDQYVPNDAPSVGENKLVYAMCVGVGNVDGKPVTVCKRGDTVLVDEWAKQGFKISDDVYIASSWCVKGIVKVSK